MIYYMSVVIFNFLEIQETCQNQTMQIQCGHTEICSVNIDTSVLHRFLQMIQKIMFTYVAILDSSFK